jgi:hypothetical protein
MIKDDNRPVMSRLSGLLLIGLIGLVSLIADTLGDDKYSSSSEYGIPVALQSSLDERLAMFIAAQVKQQWEDVAALLGRYRKGGSGFLYTPEHKKCLLQQIQSSPMLSFAVESTAYSSELYTTPPDRHWWFLTGLGEFKKSSGIVRRPATVVAYRDQGEWYFTPPNYDDEWEESHVTPDDRIADYSSEIQVDLHPGCPLAVRDLQVHMHNKFLSLRVMTYALVNNSRKRVTGYTLQLLREGGSITAGLPTTIDPGTVSRHEKPLTYSAYSYWCDGVSRHRFIIDSVDFADGSKWHDPRYQTSANGQAFEQQ